MTKASGRGKRGKVSNKAKRGIFGASNKSERKPKNKTRSSRRRLPGEITKSSWLGNS